MTYKMSVTLLLPLVLALALAQGPGNGVSKTTFASTWPWPGMAFIQKYFPTTCAEDSGSGNVQNGYTFQGRSQLTLSGYFSSRNCQLFSAADGSKSSSSTSLTPPGTNYGSDCTYSQGSEYASSTPMYSVYAHTADQCCKACQAASVVAGGKCVAATFTEAKANQSTTNTSEGSKSEGAVSMLEVGQGPQYYEGFGLHLVDVSTSKTTGGMNISALEAQFASRLGDMSGYDAFMDFNVVLYAGDDLPSYYAALSKDSVDVLTATWSAHDGSSWYSLIVAVPHSQMVIELVSDTAPSSDFDATKSVSLEPRLSPRQIKRFGSSGKAGGVLQAVAVTRGVTNMTTIESFYENAIGATQVHKINAGRVSRTCYAWSGAASDVCFVNRPDGTLGTTSETAKAFTVGDYAATLWAGHKAMIKDKSGISTTTDQYNDNHYAVDLRGFSGADDIVTWFNKHESEAFPIDYPNTYFAWDCMQNYIIDPTGFSIQCDFQFSSGGLPGCGYNNNNNDNKDAHAQALTPVVA